MPETSQQPARRIGKAREPQGRVSEGDAHFRKDGSTSHASNGRYDNITVNDVDIRQCRTR